MFLFNRPLAAALASLATAALFVLINSLLAPGSLGG